MVRHTSLIFSAPYVLFGVVLVDSPLSGPQQEVVAIVTLLARKIILLNCKWSSAPTFRHWNRNVFTSLCLEKISLSLRCKPHFFPKIRDPYKDWQDQILNYFFLIYVFDLIMIFINILTFICCLFILYNYTFKIYWCVCMRMLF